VARTSRLVLPDMAERGLMSCAGRENSLNPSMRWMVLPLPPPWICSRPWIEDASVTLKVLVELGPPIRLVVVPAAVAETLKI